MTQRFQFSQSGDVAEITFDDGGMNLLSTDALGDLAFALHDISSLDPSVLLFRSGRQSIFAAGADMQEMQEFDGFAAGEFAALGQAVFASIERLECVTIVAVDGDCFGGALDLALAFDVRLATVRSRFSHPGGRLGIVTGFGGTSRWRELIDRGRVGRLFLDNASLDAAQAYEIGLVTRITEAEAAREISSRCASADRALVRALKEISIRGAHLPYDALHRIAPRIVQLHRGGAA